MAALAEVPSKYDIALTVGATTTGFKFLDTLDGSYLSASRHKAEYTATPTFVERQNVSGAYGDDQQAFFLTESQNDWGLGEGQRHFKVGDQDSQRKYWRSVGADITMDGQIGMTRNTIGWSMAAAAASATADNGLLAVTTATNLYTIDTAGAVTDRGAHGLGAAPSRNSMVVGVRNDGIMMTTTTAGTVGVRAWTGIFTTFSASGADSLALLNNTLYGFRYSSGDLVRWDTAGVLTSLFTWRDASGNAITSNRGIVAPFGGKLLVFLSIGSGGSGCPELWVYDGVAPAMVAQFPPDLGASLITIGNICVLNGVVYVAGSQTTWPWRNVIYFWANGNIGKLWESDAPGTGNAPTAMCVFKDSLVFLDAPGQKILAYTPASSAIATLRANVTLVADNNCLAGNSYDFVLTNSTGSHIYPATSAPTFTTVDSSLFDFGNSLVKLMRGVKVDWLPGSDGNGGSVDISYQLDSVDGSYTSLQASAVAGTEYTLPTATTARSISVRVTLNKGTSTMGPKLQRIYVRAAPILQSFRVRTYNLDLTATPALPTSLRDGTTHPLTGFEQAQNLQTAIVSQVPITVKDKFGTYTGVCEPGQCSIFELHADSGAGGSEATPGQFSATVVIREV